MTVLRFPAGAAVGRIWWDGVGADRPAAGTVEVPDGAAVELAVGRSRYRGKKRDRKGDGYGNKPRAVDLDFIRDLPADSVSSLSLTDVVPASFAAVAHLAPGLRDLSVFIDDLGADAPAVIAELMALESLDLAGHNPLFPGDEPTSQRLDDHALSAIANLPALESLTLLGGSYTERGLRELTRLVTLRRLEIEREGLTAPMFRFAAALPALTELDWLDSSRGYGPTPPAEIERVRAMLPHISVCEPAR